MSDLVLLNLLNELRKNDKMLCLATILSLFRTSLINLIIQEARMLDSIYHMALTLLKNRIFGAKTSRFCHLLRSVIKNVIT